MEKDFKGCNKLIGQFEESNYALHCDNSYHLCNDCKIKKKEFK